MVSPRKIICVMKCFSSQLYSSHYCIANSFLKGKTAKCSTAFLIFLYIPGSSLLDLKYVVTCGSACAELCGVFPPPFF